MIWGSCIFRDIFQLSVINLIKQLNFQCVFDSNSKYSVPIISYFMRLLCSNIARDIWISLFDFIAFSTPIFFIIFYSHWNVNLVFNVYVSLFEDPYTSDVSQLLCQVVAGWYIYKKALVFLLVFYYKLWYVWIWLKDSDFRCVNYRVVLHHFSFTSILCCLQMFQSSCFALCCVSSGI